MRCQLAQSLLRSLCLLLIVWPTILAAAPAVPTPTGPDFENQGEFVGEVPLAGGISPIGVQVIAGGNGEFVAVAFPGGLPGEGWDRTAPTWEKGRLKSNRVVEFGGGPAITTTLQDGVIRISSAGAEIAQLKQQVRVSPTLDDEPPKGAIVLFDGRGTERFDDAQVDGDNLLLPGCTSKEKFGSGKLHLEFRVPFLPKSDDQARGNSGVFLQGRYEIQILDSFGFDESEKSCGAIFGLRAPDQNMSYPPFYWQTYDIDFTAPRFVSGKKADGSQAVITVKQNGVTIHRRAKVSQPTARAPLGDEAPRGPLVLEDRGQRVRFRNIWFLPGQSE